MLAAVPLLFIASWSCGHLFTFLIPLNQSTLPERVLIKVVIGLVILFSVGEAYLAGINVRT